MPRPFCSLSVEIFSSIADLKSERCNSSFPSAHFGLAMIFAYSLWNEVSGKIYKIFIITVVFLVGVARISLAMHYPIDLIGSFFITLIVIITGKIIFCYFKRFFVLLENKLFTFFLKKK